MSDVKVDVRLSLAGVALALSVAAAHPRPPEAYPASAAVAVAGFILCMAGVVPVAGIIVFHLAYSWLESWHDTLCPRNPMLAVAYWVYIVAATIVTTVSLVLLASLATRR